jgi:uncharacterized protein
MGSEGRSPWAASSTWRRRRVEAPLAPSVESDVRVELKLARRPRRGRRLRAEPPRAPARRALGGRKPCSASTRGSARAASVWWSTRRASCSTTPSSTSCRATARWPAPAHAARPRAAAQARGDRRRQRHPRPRDRGVRARGARRHRRGRTSVVPSTRRARACTRPRDVAREEFPELDVTVRGAISIARRLQDPLAELVKVDPKSIGVGQYQHDVYQPLLARKLDEVVESCVNHVGVELNTASAPLLAASRASAPRSPGASSRTARCKGAFTRAKALLEVSRPRAAHLRAVRGLRARARRRAPARRAAPCTPSATASSSASPATSACRLSALVGNAELAAKVDVARST